MQLDTMPPFSRHPLPQLTTRPRVAEQAAHYTSLRLDDNDLLNYDEEDGLERGW